jgi:hypothetical protein
MEFTEFRATNGWLHRFKKRNSFKSYAISGDVKNISQEVVQQGQIDLQKELKGFELKDVYNVDEAGLFYKYPPTKTIAASPQTGTKKSKERITVVLCTNADG